MINGTPFGILAILVVFYLYLLVRPQYIKRPFCMLIGAAGLLLAIVGEFFTLGRATEVVCEIFTIIGNLLAFVGAIATCFGGKLPGVDNGKLGSQTIEPPKPQQ